MKNLYISDIFLLISLKVFPKSIKRIVRKEKYIYKADQVLCPSKLLHINKILKLNLSKI